MVGDQVAALDSRGFCVLEKHFDPGRIGALRESFWPTLVAYLEKNRDSPNRGPHRHFLPMPWTAQAVEFFFDETILAIVRRALGDGIAADQWGCDVPVLGSAHQNIHKDYQRPLFEELPDLELPAYMLAVSFPLTGITAADGPIEMVRRGSLEPEPILMNAGDVLIRHPWTLHRGSPNLSATPRALCTIRYVRRWYADSSREVSPMPRELWDSLSEAQRQLLRFPSCL